MGSNVFELKGLYNEAINYIESKKEKNLAFVPAICGADYENCNSKIMIVGRAPNGWSMDFYENNNCVPKNWFDAGLSWVYQNGPKKRNGEEHKASIKNSKYWQFVRYLMFKSGNCKNANFTDGLVWTNLFKISNRNLGNPDDSTCKETLQIMDNVLCAEIKYYKPQEIWFITKKNKKAVGEYENNNSADNWLYWVFNGKLAFEKTLNFINDNNVLAKMFYRPEYRKFDEIEKGILLKDIEIPEL